jgi:hypothetical protein
MFSKFSLALAFWIERPPKSSSILLKTAAFSDVDFNIHSSNLILLFEFISLSDQPEWIMFITTEHLIEHVYINNDVRFHVNIKKTDLFIKMPKSCNKVFSYSIAISDCVPLSSDGEERAGYISIPSINNNTTMIINHEPHQTSGLNQGTPEGQVVFVLLFYLF